MRVLFISAAAIWLAACSGESVSDLRQPAIDKCATSTLKGTDAPKATSFCTCAVDSMIATVPPDDAVKALKLMIAEPKNEDEAAKALGVSVEDAKAFGLKLREAMKSVSGKCKL